MYAYFDPEISFDRDQACTYGKMEKSLDRRLSAKSCDRILAKSNKMSVVRTKTYPLMPDRNGSLPSASHTRSNSFKDRKYSERYSESEGLVNVSPDTYVSCAVGRKCSAARFSLENVNEVVSFVKMLADACPCVVVVKSNDYQRKPEDFLVQSDADVSPDEDSEDSVSLGSDHSPIN